MGEEVRAARAGDADVDTVTSAAIAASRLLVAIAACSLASPGQAVTLPGAGRTCSSVPTTMATRAHPSVVEPIDLGGGGAG